MQRLLDSTSQMTVMTSVVTTLMYFPVVAILAVLSIVVLGISFHSFLTFGDTFNAFTGLLAWWIALFLPAFAYVAWMYAAEHG